jgi:glycine/D-amino acid oxidase-like deaminating enzyme/nitrite reductase/ring-hydroxylating ferredoxin subunit
VAVVGGGIVGLTTALQAAQGGASVALLEARRLGSGASGLNTAKLSSLHGLTYAQLISTQGEELARLYGEANQRGIERVVTLTEELDIECELRRKPHVVYSEDPGLRDDLEDEVAAAKSLGLPASFERDTDLPFGVAGAVAFADQAEFHPLRYLEGIAAAAEDGGVEIYEGSRVEGVDFGHPARVRTLHGPAITARHVVLACHMPFLTRGLFWARAHPERSYVVAGLIPEGPAGMYLSADSPTRSIRVHETGGDRWLLVGGEGHKTGQGDGITSYERLEDWAQERFGLEQVELRWASEDHISADKVPFVGPVDPATDNVWVATGFRKWGLAMGTAAAEVLTAGVMGAEHRWAPLFDTGRLRPRAAAVEFVKENANVGLRFFADRLIKRAGEDDIPPGEGRVVGSGLGQKAVYRDEDGTLHRMSARCTHLGCIVNWNRGDQTWDCPCHGGRFSPRGEVLEGPPVHDLGEA